MGRRKRYAHVGLGGRSTAYTDAMVGAFKDCCELVGICDVSQGRMALSNRRIERNGARPVRTFDADAFDRMIAEAKPDTVIVTTGPDATHTRYICRAMELGCDVVTEKPMTIDDVSCRKIVDTIAKTGRNLQVTFNYRYAPPRSQIKAMLMDGTIGEVLSVDFAWLLGTHHGADYFRRWHRRRENSGSLLVHKSTHHFDLVNWWLDDVPEEVFGRGALRYYTPARADSMGLQDRGQRCLECPARDRCKFYLDIRGEGFREMYLDCEAETGYVRDKCLFSGEIDIWDNMAVSVRYRRGALLNYMLHAYSPREGYRIAFNGTRGRLEHACRENTYVSGDGRVPGEVIAEDVAITLIPEFSQAQQVEVKTSQGGHGGADPLLLADVFDPDAPAEPLKRKAGHRDGAYSILTGVAAAKSIDSGLPVKVSSLLGDSCL